MVFTVLSSHDYIVQTENDYCVFSMSWEDTKTSTLICSVVFEEEKIGQNDDFRRIPLSFRRGSKRRNSGRADEGEFSSANPL